MALALAERPGRMSPEEFRAFDEATPDGEHWELLEGVPVQVVSPPLLTHALIASRLQRLLDDALARHDPTKIALQRSGCWLADTDDYRPEPDLAVMDADLPASQRCIERAYLVAEIVSSSDRERVPGTREPTSDARRRVYRLHDPCLAILAIEQDQIDILVETRTPAGWTSARLTEPGQELALPAFGLRCAAIDLYENTHLGRRRAGR